MTQSRPPAHATIGIKENGGGRRLTDRLLELVSPGRRGRASLAVAPHSGAAGPAGLGAEISEMGDLMARRGCGIVLCDWVVGVVWVRWCLWDWGWEGW